jgi:hypothetical protein
MEISYKEILSEKKKKKEEEEEEEEEREREEEEVLDSAQPYNLTKK